MVKKVIIVGAGVGGLATACRLAKDGYAVEVYEKLPVCGGRNNIIEDRGFKFDTGPSFVLMPDFFEEVFEDFRMIINLFSLSKESAAIQTPVILNYVSKRITNQFLR